MQDLEASKRRASVSSKVNSIVLYGSGDGYGYGYCDGYGDGK